MTMPCLNRDCTMAVYQNEAGYLVHADGLRDPRACFPFGHLTCLDQALTLRQWLDRLLDHREVCACGTDCTTPLPIAQLLYDRM